MLFLCFSLFMWESTALIPIVVSRMTCSQTRQNAACLFVRSADSHLLYRSSLSQAVLKEHFISIPSRTTKQTQCERHLHRKNCAWPCYLACHLAEITSSMVTKLYPPGGAIGTGTILVWGVTSACNSCASAIYQRAIFQFPNLWYSRKTPRGKRISPKHNLRPF